MKNNREWQHTLWQKLCKLEENGSISLKYSKKNSQHTMFYLVKSTLHDEVKINISLIWEGKPKQKFYNT